MLPGYFIKYSKYIYISLLAAVGISLPLSEWLLSLSIILLIPIAFYNLFTGGFISSNKTRLFLIFSVVYIVHIVWMLNTSDLSYGLSELRLKLPLLLLPFIIAVSPSLSKRETGIVLGVFVTGVVFSSIAGVFFMISGENNPAVKPEDFSPFISHIRLSIMAVLAIHICIYYLFSSCSKLINTAIMLIVAWLTLFVFLMFSFTGVLLLFITVPFALILFRRQGRKTLFMAGISLFLALSAVTLVFLAAEVKNFFKPHGSASGKMETVTLNGNNYTHYPERRDLENGNPVWINICEDEMRKEWNSISGIKYDSTDSDGNLIKYTLARYLTSLSLKKDSAGVNALSTEDIQAIENGIANKIFTGSNRLKTRIYEVVWQVHYYLIGGNPSGHSVTQRLHFFKAGFEIFRTNPVFGTGTGDLKQEFEKTYISTNSPLLPGYRLLAHNQYLTFLIMFGISGFLITALSVVIPVIKSGLSGKYLARVFLVLAFVSMLWEDTLATHTGITFFAYFYSLFIIERSEEEDK